MHTVEVKIDKLVHGGQGIGDLSDGRKIFVWGVLPGETALVRLIKNRRDYAEGVAVEIITASNERISPIDDAYLSTSPWQIMTGAAENKYKKEILIEAFDRERVILSDFDFISPKEFFGYRNKMEYSFWADTKGLNLALFNRASHNKRIVTGSSIARPEIDQIAKRILDVLNNSSIRGSQLKTIVLRVNKGSEVVAAIFVKDELFPKIPELDGICQGVAVYYSTPKSPASVITRELYQFGDIILADQILDDNISYDVNSFFQVYLPIFEEALKQIKHHVSDSSSVVDMYSGVGTIGVAVGANVLVESDKKNIKMAKINSKGQNMQIIHAASETALEYIKRDSCIIVDPPRAGLHVKVTDKLLEVLPEKIIYLSCNPSTQARDVAKLSKKYKIDDFYGYNFFPRTPHIESLAIMTRH